jgi:hypothetical protein
LVIALAGSACDDGDDSSTTPRRSPAPFERIPVPRDRHNPEYALAGNDVLVTGGYGFDDEASWVVEGARLHRGGGRGWERSDPPFSGPLSMGGAVWTGRRLIVVGQTCPGRYPRDIEGDDQIVCRGDVEAAALDPATNRWQRLDAPPRQATAELGVDIRTRGAGWTGRHGVFTFGDFSATVNIALYDPSAGRWEPVRSDGAPFDPQLPHDAPGPTVCVGNGSVLRMTFTTRNTPSFGWRLVTEAWNRRAKRWERLPTELDLDVPDDLPFNPRFSCENQTEALVVSVPSGGGGTAVHRFGGPDVGWQQLPLLPSVSGGAGLVRSEEGIAVWPDTYAHGQYYLLDPAASEWRWVRKPDDGYRWDVGGTRLVVGDDQALFVVDAFAHARKSGIPP